MHTITIWRTDVSIFVFEGDRLTEELNLAGHERDTMPIITFPGGFDAVRPGDTLWLDYGNHEHESRLVLEVIRGTETEELSEDSVHQFMISFDRAWHVFGLGAVELLPHGWTGEGSPAPATSDLLIDVHEYQKVHRHFETLALLPAPGWNNYRDMFLFLVEHISPDAIILADGERVDTGEFGASLCSVPTRDVSELTRIFEAMQASVSQTCACCGNPGRLWRYAGFEFRKRCDDCAEQEGLTRPTDEEIARFLKDSDT